MKTPTPLYRMMVIDSSQIIAPREDYQRELKSKRVKRIVSDFDERIANEPKVSYRDGKYYVFDGQHTIDARKAMNGGKDLPILCKVYMEMDEKEEALLFAKQTGESARLTPGVRVRAEIFGEDGNAVAFLKANADMGIELDYDQERGYMRIGCIKTALNAYQQLGEERYKEAMGIIVSAWGGEPDSFRRENIIGITHFVDRYHDTYIPQRLITRLGNVDPLTIPREGRAVGVDLAGYKKYLYQVWKIYNGSGKKYLMLPATPGNNKFIDLKNQLTLAYEGDSAQINEKLATTKSIDEIFRQAQKSFNAWSKLPADDRTTDELLRTLDFDFFELLDSVTIARSRKHIEKYYRHWKIP